MTRRTPESPLSKALERGRKLRNGRRRDGLRNAVKESPTGINATLERQHNFTGEPRSGGLIAKIIDFLRGSKA